jgi:hypothetical protein
MPVWSGRRADATPPPDAVLPAADRPVPYEAPPARGGTALRALAGFAVVLIAAAGGWALAGAASDDDPVAGAGARPIELGPASFEVAGGWTPARPPESLDAVGGLSFAPVPGRSARATLVFDRWTDATLIPEPLRALVDRLPSPEKASVAGLPAWRYGPLSLPRGEALDLYVVPTTAGSLALACSAAGRATAGGTDCAPGIERIALGEVLPLKAGAMTAYLQALPQVIERLDSERVAGRRQLRELDGRARARPAQQLGDAHGRAAGTLRRVEPVRTRPPRLTGALDRTASAYRRLAVAARANERQRFIRARRGVAAGEAAVARGLRALRPAR